MTFRVAGETLLFVLTLSLAAASPSDPVAASGEKPVESAHPHAKPNVMRLRAKTGHITNYDEAKVGAYTLPDPLRLENRDPVRDAKTWFERRRPELLRLYATEIYGQVPSTAPAAHAEVVARGEIEGHLGTYKHVIIHFGPSAAGPKADVVLYLPPPAAKPIPVVLQLVFYRGLPCETPKADIPKAFIQYSGGRRGDFSETAAPAEVLERGYAYATFRYTDVQPDDAATNANGVQALAYRPGQTHPEPDEWGTISAWAWATSRVLDYLGTEKTLDASRVALVGHSRLGKTVLWASAMDPRFALVFSSCSGEMGAALARRDYGETLDDMAERFPWQFARNFAKYAGHWDRLPVDAHELIALSAPRPVLISGATEDQFSDPRGEFLAEVAAGPVYRLVGMKDLGSTTMPSPDTPLITGDLGWLYHTGGHAILPADWTAFLDFADRHLK